MGPYSATHIEPPRELNSRQELFVSAYLLCNVAAEAARMAGYKDAKSAAAYLMNHPLVLEEIQFVRESVRRRRYGLSD
jgi:phage terminase small subunit